MAVVKLALSDAFAGQHPSERHLVEGMLGTLTIQARECGWPGTMLVDASWEPARDGRPPACTIVLQPGTGQVTVDDVRGFIHDKRERAAAQEKGRLL